MCEDVNEQFSLRLEPAGDVRQQPLVIFHVLKHFHRNHAVEFFGNVEMIHVAGDDAEICQPAVLRLGVNMLLLRCRIGNPVMRAFGYD